MMRFSSGDSESELAINLDGETNEGGFVKIVLLLPDRASADCTRRHCTEKYQCYHIM
jgi:hypothetical protein